MKIDYTIKGTKLPIIPEGTEYRCSNWDYDDMSTRFMTTHNDFVSFGWNHHKGYTYILCEKENYKGVAYFMVKLSDIKKLTKTQEPMRTIKYSDAQRIVDSACLEWKELLFNSWGKDIVLKKDINIPSENYQNMRNACTEAQHKLFDEIFGEDKPQFKIGDWVYKHYGDKKGLCEQILNVTDVDILTSCGCYVVGNYFEKYYRLATEEEIKAANVFADGTPCLVRDVHNGRWMLAYANGKGSFYNCIEKKWMAYDFKYSMKLDMDNLPVNK